MAVAEIKTPTTFRASDGQEFDTKADAEAHDRLITARNEYEDARVRYGRLLAETQITADGRRFDFNTFGFYYRVVPGWGSWPEVQRVHPWARDLGFQDGELVLFAEVNGSRTDFRISELYRSKEAAEKAMVKEMEARIKERQEEIADYKERLGISS